MGLLWFLFLLLHFAAARFEYDDRPRIFLRNGNLVLSASPYKNITFETSKTSGITINDIDLLSTVNKAYDATKLTDNYYKTLSTYNDRLESLEDQLLHGITNANLSAPKSNATDVTFRIRKINRRLFTLERWTNNLKTLLSKDDCVSNPCKNGGVCEDLVLNYRCQCPDGWEGKDCTKNINECYRFAGTDLGCQNGATCRDTPGSYQCICAPGWVGIHCMRRTADCLTGGKELCGHGVCVQHANDIGYKCICDQGYTTDGVNPACTKDVDECNLNVPACSVNPKVECRNVPGSYFCGFCPQGYSGNGYHCSDIDECSVNNGGCSQSPLVNCINIPGSKICGSCPSGYSGDGVICAYEGECSMNNGGCHPLATCKQNSKISASGVDCICPMGYIGDGRGPYGCTLNAQNPCDPNPCKNGECTVTANRDYTCKCRNRYTGKNCDVLGRDPCKPNPCLNDGECQNLAFLAFVCKCKNGFTGILCALEEAACGRSIKSNNGVLKYPPDNYQNYKRYANCAWTIVANDSTKVLNVTFKKFELTESTDCHANFLQIHDGSNTIAPTKGRFCGKKLPLGGNFTSTHNRLYFWYKQDNDISNVGFEIMWNTTQWKCGGVVNDQHGSIWSPGSPGKYPLRRDCWWRLLAPPGKRYFFMFYSLDIGDNKDCGQDLIQFFTMLDYMRENDKFKRICNSTKPAPFYSPGNEVMIHFHSNLKDAYYGFQLNYAVVEGTPGCGGVHTAASGYLTPPTDSADLSINCEYTIEQPSISKVKIYFIKFNLGDDCEKAYIEVFESNNSSLGRYCGSIIPPPYLSNENRLRIVYVNSLRSEEIDIDWKIKYERNCGQKFTNESGSFKPSAYYSTNGIECVYQIERPPGYIIQLLLKINDHGQRIFGSARLLSYVEVRDGDLETSPLINIYYGNRFVNITSTYNSLWIKLKIHVFSYVIRDPAKFFKADYTSVKTGCGGILRDQFGYISSPNHIQSGYPPGSQCKWIIIAPTKSIIKLSWQTFNIEQSYNCAYDYVKVFDNSTNLGNGEEVGKYCGSSLPPVVFSSSNIMTVVFNSDLTVSKGEFLASYVFIKEENACNVHYASSAGVLKSPSYPNMYPVNQECIYTISVTSGQQILLNVTDFDIEYSSGCRYDWLEIRNGGNAASPLIGKYCGNQTAIPKLIWSHNNKVYFFFKSDISRVTKGFRIEWSSATTGCGGTLTSPTGSITSPNYPEPYGRNAECNWKIVVNSGSRIQIHFTDLNLEMYAQCSADFVQLFDGLTTNSQSLGKFCSRSDGLITTTSNKMLVKFRSDVNLEGRGFSLRYTTMCHNTLRGFYGVIESPNFPDGYPENQDCLWEIVVPDKNKINVTFSHFELEDALTLTNTTCQYDYVEIKYPESTEVYSGEEPKYIQYGKYCGNTNPGHLSINSDHVLIHFVTDKLLLGSGFRLEWMIWGCGGHVKKNSGTISSPNYPKPYPPSIVCEWLIEVELGYSVEIEFFDVDIEKTDNCDFDYIKIYNGPSNSSNELSTICRQKKSSILSSTGNFMYIEFKADYSYQGKGFTANYTSVTTNCGGRMSAESGVIHSPNYPNNYNRNETCGWLIDVDEGHSVELVFNDVDLYETNNCTFNYVKVHDGPTEAYPVLAQICGTITPNETIRSTSNHMFINFRTHVYITTKGFKATYHKSCGSKITTQSNGIITVDKNEFSDVKKCLWTISSTDLSRHVSLLISQIHGYDYCDSYDNGKPIKIYNGDSTSAPLMGSFCEEKVPPMLISDGSSITIELDNPLVTFVATYSVFDSHCGGTLSAEGGYFSSPGYRKKYPSDMQCEWIINISLGNHVSLNFLTFDLPTSGCDSDYLEIRNNNSSGRLIGIYCGTNKPNNVKNVGPLWLLFKSQKIQKGDTVNAKGFYAEYEMSRENELTGSRGQIYSPLYPTLLLKYGGYSWKITVRVKRIILLTFNEFYLESEDPENECYFGDLEIFDGIDSTATSLGKFCGVTNPKPVKSTSNVMFIKISFFNPRMGSRFKLEWLEINEAKVINRPTKNMTCGSNETIDINTLNNYTLTSPGFPNGYGHNLHCTWIFSTTQMNHISIYFYSLDLGVYQRRYLDNKCFFTDVVKVSTKEDTENDWKLMTEVCRSDNLTRTMQGKNLVKVEFITNSYINATGFKMYLYEYCGGHLTEPSGYIIQKNNTIFGSNECQWNITVGSTKIIEITFEDMYILNSHPDVCDDYLLIKNGKFPDSPFLGKGKYCGTELPSPLRSTGNSLYIKYKGRKVNKNAFRLKYQEILDSCGGEIVLTSFDNSTEISSPNYPNIPKPHTECHWIIRGPADESLRIDFEERFDLTVSKNCEVEYVELRDGGTEYSTLIDRFCKSSPNTQLTTGNILFVKFFTDNDEPKNGFKAKIYLGYCGGTVRGPIGTIKLSNLPSNIKNPVCEWTIVGPVDHYLNLQFTKLNMLFCSNTNDSIDYVSIFESNSENRTTTLLGKYCNKNNIGKNITSSSNKVLIRFRGSNTAEFTLNFRASQSKCGGILREESGEITSPNYPNSVNYNRICFWRIEVPEGRRVTVEMIDLDFSAGPNRQMLSFYDGLDLRYFLKIFTQMPQNKIIESTSNMMMVRYWVAGTSNHRGFKLKYTSNNPTFCTGDFSQQVGIIHNPEARNKSYYCKWTRLSNKLVFNETLAVTVNSITSFRSNNICIRAPGEIFLTNQDKLQILGSVCKTTTNPVVFRSPYLINNLMARINSHFSMNFTASYRVYPCGGILNQQSGIIQSPILNNQPDFVQCAWLLEVDVGQTINLTTIEFNLQDCDKTFVAIYNGPSPRSPQIGKFCRTNKPDPILSQTNKIWIEYQGDRSSTGTGIKMKYEATSHGCSGTFHDKSRIISTPNYPKNYPENAECLWDVIASDGFIINLEFIDRFHLEESAGCTKDFLEIFDWKDDIWVSLGKKCGREAPVQIKSSSNKLRILFRSNDQIAAGGFKAKWDWHCGGKFTASNTPRYIVSPGYPMTYENVLKCVYTIQPKPGKVLIMRFLDFELEGNLPDCRFDNLTMSTTGVSSYAFSNKKVYCGDVKPPSVRLKGSVIITFNTDYFLTKRGFKLVYSAESCGGNITEETVIETNSFYSRSSGVHYYEPIIQCRWNITAPPKMQVVLTIINLEMSYSSLCYGQHVSIYKSLDLKLPNRLAKICSKLENVSILSDTGSMAVALMAFPTVFGGFKAAVSFSHGPEEGCGGTINLTDVTYISSPSHLKNIDCTWKIIALQDNTVNIEISTLKFQSCTKANTTSCQCAFVEIKDGNSPFSEKIEKICPNSKFVKNSRTLTTSFNRAYIRIYMKQQDEFKAKLTPKLSICGHSRLNVTSTPQMITSPNYPNPYPANVRCTYLFFTTYAFNGRIRLHFVDFELTEELPPASGHQLMQCQGDTIEIYESSNLLTDDLGPTVMYNGGPSKNLYLIYNNGIDRNTFCGKDDKPFDYYSAGKQVTFVMNSLDNSQKGKGFKLQYFLDDCNKNYSAPSGQVIDNHQVKKNCSFYIVTPENRTISLYFFKFALRLSQNCTIDSFEIREQGPNGNVLMRSCGYALPNPIFSFTNQLYVSVQTKVQVNYLWYEFTYTSTDKGRGCGGEIYNIKGKIYSPLYPSQFRNDTICDWILKVPVGLHSVLKFSSFDLQGSCEETYVEVSTHTSSNPTEVTTTRFCKNDNPGVLRSESSIEIRFKSSINNGGAGWVAIYRSVNKDFTNIPGF